MDNLPEIRAYLLGAFRLERAGQVLPLPHSTPARDLLAYLLLHRARPRPRSVLAGVFWPECSEEQARRALSAAVWHINRAVPNVVAANSALIHVAGPAAVWVDVEAFAERITPCLTAKTSPAAAHALLQQAIELYSGDLLEGVYAEWVSAPREQLRMQYHTALEQLIQLEKNLGRYDHALQFAVRLSQADPLRETAQREVMRLHLALNRPQSALRQYEVCRQVLREEMNAEPDAETTALARAIAEIARRAGNEVPAYIPQLAPRAEDTPLFVQERPGHLPLIGRDKERGQLLTHLEALWQTPLPQNNLVLIEGEAGVGKTRLMQELARDAQWRGAHVLWGHGRDLEAARPCALLVEALESGLTPLRYTELSRGD
jgi:DNA-binding SARP family transcriptional activator